MIENYIGHFTTTERKVLAYSIFLGILFAIASYIGYSKFYLDFLLGSPQKYSVQKIVYDCSITLITTLGAILPFVVCRKPIAILSLAVIVLCALGLQKLLADYSWDPAIDPQKWQLTPFIEWVTSLSQRIVFIPSISYIVAIAYAISFKKNLLISLLAAFLATVFVEMTYHLVTYLSGYPLASVASALFTWICYWTVLFFFTNEFTGLKDLAIKIKNQYTSNSGLPLKPYRKAFVCINAAMIFVLLAIIPPYKLFAGTGANFLLMDVIKFSAVFLLIYIYSITLLVRRLIFMKLSMDYIWLKFIPIANLYLIYLTVIKNE